MCGTRSWHTYEMHLVSLRKSGVTKNIWLLLDFSFNRVSRIMPSLLGCFRIGKTQLAGLYHIFHAGNFVAHEEGSSHTHCTTPTNTSMVPIRSSMTLATRTNVGSAHHKDVKSIIHTRKPRCEIKKIYEGIVFHTSSPLHPYYFIF
jgi:hypothetical protein